MLLIIKSRKYPKSLERIPKFITEKLKKFLIFHNFANTIFH